jgi:hypothetical protein
MTNPDDHLTGPWKAVLAYESYAIDSLDKVDPEDEVSISIRRDSALPSDDGTLPGTYNSGDIIELWDGLYVEDGNPSTEAPARWAQAQAMAAGLNAAGAVA